MQKLLGQMRCAVDRYHMIAEGDRIAIGISGGKDSVALLAGMSALRRFYPARFELTAVTLDPCFGGMKQTIPPLSSCAASWKSPTGCGARSSAKLSLKRVKKKSVQPVRPDAARHAAR